ncbi:MAG TPA: hypothetical protein VG944_07590 [Fimbriimonas sp.]|nr:hypothetical protein [Fimbriimonas sp.]
MRRSFSRSLAGILFLTLALAHASNVLILIRRERAGPLAPVSYFLHGLWVQWPPHYPANTQNGLMSPMTGEDWVGGEGYLQFTSGSGLSWRSPNVRSLEQRGYFAARAKYLGPSQPVLISLGRKPVGSEMLFEALSGKEPWVYAKDGVKQIPKGQLGLFQADSWDSAMYVSRNCGGRALIVEYPPEAGVSWSRAWLYGRGWPLAASVPLPGDTRMPGLIAAKELVRLLLSPTSFQWEPPRLETWGGANRWLERQRFLSPFVGAAMLGFAVVALVFAIACIQRERKSRLAAELLTFAALLPIADLIAGGVARLQGLSAFYLSFIVALLVLRGLSQLSSRIAAIGFLGTASFLVCDPLWSDFGAAGNGVSFAACGFLVTYLALFMARLSRNDWLALGLAGSLTAYGIAFRPWWVQGHPTFAVLPLVSFAAVMGPIRWATGTILFLVPVIDLPRIDHFSWSPWGLLSRYSDLHGFDLSRYPLTLLSPLFIASGFAIMILAIATVGFAQNRFSKLLKGDDRQKTLFRAAMALACLGALEPGLWTAGLLCVFGGMISLCYETLATV